MKIANFDVRYVSHVCFILTSPQGAVILTDPLFAEGFEWKGRIERYISRPDIAAGDIRRCDGVFVSHIHGDHFDPDAIETIVRNTGAQVWAPPDVADALRERGLAEDRLVALAEGMALRLSDVAATAFAGYDCSFDEEDRPNKFSLLLECNGRRVFYSGDCHDAPPAMAGRKVDAVFAWPHPDDAKLAAFAKAIPADRYVLMHGDRFDPGDFFCNLDYEEQKSRVERLAPGVEAIIPQRIHALAS